MSMILKYFCCITQHKIFWLLFFMTLLWTWTVAFKLYKEGPPFVHKKIVWLKKNIAHKSSRCPFCNVWKLCFCAMKEIQPFFYFGVNYSFNRRVVCFDPCIKIHTCKYMYKLCIKYIFLTKCKSVVQLGLIQPTATFCQWYFLKLNQSHCLL